MQAFSIKGALAFAGRTITHHWATSLKVIGIGFIYLLSQLAVLAAPFYILYYDLFKDHFADLQKINWTNSALLVNFFHTKIMGGWSGNIGVFLLLIGFIFVYMLTQAFVYVFFIRAGLLEYHKHPVDIGHLFNSISPALVLKAFVGILIMNLPALMQVAGFVGISLVDKPAPYLSMWLPMILGIAASLLVIRLAFYVYHMSDYDGSIMESIKASISLTGNLVWLKLLLLSVMLGALVGVITLPFAFLPYGWIVGLLFPYIFVLAMVYAYKRVESNQHPVA